MPKEKKTKKSKKAEDDDQQDSELTSVDKQFFELQIEDTNKKLNRLRTHNVKIEEKNEQLEATIKQMEENRKDVTSFLNRTLHEKVNTIQELENKLTELSKVRLNENENFKNRTAEWENKFKTMHDNLSSEIKLLTGKLNSMEEFRLQRDDLMAKFDTQEMELKEQAKIHKATLYDMEKKVILDKERMRKDVENKLLELSTEFTKTSDLRVAASTQRLVRENISLSNDIDRVMLLKEKLQQENEEIKKKQNEFQSQYDANILEKKCLTKNLERQLCTIKKLTSECENLTEQNNCLKEIKRTYEVARKMTKDSRSELIDMHNKIRILEDHVAEIDNDRLQLKADANYYRHEYNRVTDIIKSVRSSVLLALEGNYEQSDPNLKVSLRRNLLTDLLNVLNNIERHRKKVSQSGPSGKAEDFYSQGDLGMIPKNGEN
ncbi:CLUMA_CG007916, isoform A [Clunio marinus]|uniref:Cilia- and flagella-associated protein 157 n=1 Tax=Clunio marinus TaxID=568069 RepID=A0A1J1I7M1_9DIPT|nr:CLUMA_CG007916, isoform A [Clunio marinus]